MRKIFTLSILLSALTISPAAFAYEAETVNNGGSILGTVTFKGPPVHPKALQVSKDEAVCGKTTKHDPSLIVSNGAIENAVVFITNIQKGKKMAAQAVTLDQRDCEYHPHVLAFPAGSTVNVLNPDGILHNIHSYSQKNTVFDFAQPKYRKTLSVKIDKAEAIRIQCDVHDWMTGWLFAAENPYYAVTGANGSFRLDDIPPGTYTVEVWHETLGTHTQTVTVKPHAETKVSFELTKK